jgi:hypothetical protein
LCSLPIELIHHITNAMFSEQLLSVNGILYVMWLDF